MGKADMSWSKLTAAAAGLLAVGAITTVAMADEPAHKVVRAKHRAAHVMHRAAPADGNVALGAYPPGYGGGASFYDGPIFNPEGQEIGYYRGPVLGYSTSCDILTPHGPLYTCMNFTW